mgnify:CR=1 FL=1
MENTNVLFDRKRLVRLIVPLIVEQVLAVTVGMADMVMVSGAGETAVSGISLVKRRFRCRSPVPRKRG